MNKVQILKLSHQFCANHTNVPGDKGVQPQPSPSQGGGGLAHCTQWIFITHHHLQAWVHLATDPSALAHPRHAWVSSEPYIPF